MIASSKEGGVSTENKRSDETRERILAAASRLFADKGYRATTVAQICRMAQANIAAVNYHFGSKEALYQRAWCYAHDKLHERIPFDSRLAEDQPAPERLRAQLRASLQRALSEDDPVVFRIMRNEMTNPTGLLRQVIEDAIQPIRQIMRGILGELLGPEATQRHVDLCEVLMISPIMYIACRREAEEHMGIGPVFGKDMIEDMADHFSSFALAGVQGVRRRIEGSASPATGR
jgi:AcrR family transcriptional regulator